MYFLMAGLWGVADAVWLVQINGKSKLLIHYNKANGIIYNLYVKLKLDN